MPILSFFFSAALDNLTTAIVMSALLTKLIKDKEDLWMFAGMIIIAANAGGAWSPIGDVTTIMLWIGGQVTASNIITSIIIPSMVCLIVPMIYISFRIKGNISNIKIPNSNDDAYPWIDRFKKDYPNDIKEIFQQLRKKYLKS